MTASVFEISRSGMDVEWLRVTTIAQNVANMNTTRTGNGLPYQPVRLVSGPKAVFSLEEPRRLGGPTGLSGVQVYGVERLRVPPRMVHEPSHPHADANGFVAYPGVDHAGEMTLMVKSLRIYEANVAMANAAKQMYTKALEIGSRG
ncbi:flagellar basal body rod protein FlgC [Cupriavidus basilensis]|uniref:Flagellar basal-body rod protein FlgC n=1 Tax=Cupriavidus basilensis TaxID=68895 RepID=A0ABT6AYQ3_9BURK|nr:flagellar basal body rod protein FlgC [Cupriavidus basilensis]MDF3836831.1 flagellar basal body rod protein FlgC [Cupriavidus basilensis]